MLCVFKTRSLFRADLTNVFRADLTNALLSLCAESGTLLLPESQSLDFTRFNIMILKRLRAYLQRKSAEAVLHMANPVEVEALLLNSKFLMVETTLISNLVQVLCICQRCAFACSRPLSCLASDPPPPAQSAASERRNSRTTCDAIFALQASALMNGERTTLPRQVETAELPQDFRSDLNEIKSALHQLQRTLHISEEDQAREKDKLQERFKVVKQEFDDLRYSVEQKIGALGYEVGNMHKDLNAMLESVALEQQKMREQMLQEMLQVSIPSSNFNMLRVNFARKRTTLLRILDPRIA